MQSILHCPPFDRTSARNTRIAFGVACRIWTGCTCFCSNTPEGRKLAGTKRILVSLVLVDERMEAYIHTFRLALVRLRGLSRVPANVRQSEGASNAKRLQSTKEDETQSTQLYQPRRDNRKKTYLYIRHTRLSAGSLLGWVAMGRVQRVTVAKCRQTMDCGESVSKVAVMPSPTSIRDDARKSETPGDHDKTPTVTIADHRASSRCA